jgi:hypothetical protein
MDMRGSHLVPIGGAALLGSYIVDRLAQEPVSEIVVFTVRKTVACSSVKQSIHEKHCPAPEDA